MTNHDDFLQQLQKSITHKLPGEDAHIPMSPTGRGRTSELLQFAKNYRQSAVAIILFLYQDNLRIILTERMPYDGPHSSQISFPGGRYEDNDTFFYTTAIRETREEIGIILQENHLFGKLSNVYIPVSRFLIHPFVFFYSGTPVFKNNYEVKETFSISLRQLLDNQFVTKMTIDTGDTKLTVPCFSFEGKNIWGATAIILNELKQLVQITQKDLQQ